MRKSYDLCVVGGGPGGSAAAITAARLGLQVLLLDKDMFPRHKVCGEFVSFESHKLLNTLLGKEIGGRAIDSIRLFRGEHVWTSSLPEKGMSITRHYLDEMLVHAAHDAGVDVRTECRVQTVEQRQDGFELAAAEERIRARNVINAAGRWSELRAERKLSGPRWIGVKQHFRETNPPASTDLYFFRGGYCGVQPIGGDIVNACALVQADVASSLEQVISLSAKLTARAREWTPHSEPITTAPIIFGAPQPISNGMLNVGDAAAFIDPFLGDGISIALQTGVLAAECLANGGRERYQAEYHRRVTPALKRAALLRRASHSSFAWMLLRWPGLISAAARVTRVKAA
jgi:flavin-dependent dehydrogenase